VWLELFQALLPQPTISPWKKKTAIIPKTRQGTFTHNPFKKRIKRLCEANIEGPVQGKVMRLSGVEKSQK